jgi:hypothetical protein
VPVGAVGCSEVRRALDAAAEAVRRGAQGELGIDLELARDVDGSEQDVADLVERRVAVATSTAPKMCGCRRISF